MGLSDVLAVVVASGVVAGGAWAAEPPKYAPEAGNWSDVCSTAAVPAGGRVVCADLAALDQTLVYNRFGSYNPFGMIFALRRDLASAEGSAETLDADRCGALLGTEVAAEAEALEPGRVRLKDCKRPRPVVLRVNVGDELVLRVTNFLAEPEAPDFSRDFCDGQTSDVGRTRVRIGVRDGDALEVSHGEADCKVGAEKGDPGATEPEGAPDWPRTRGVNLVVQGLHPLPDPLTSTVDPACRGLDAVGPGEDFVCRYRVDQEGTYFFASPAAPAGGEGDGGSIVHGLFGAVLAERQGSRWYRSQVSRAALDAAWPRQAGAAACATAATGAMPADGNHARLGAIDYEAVDCDGTPILNMARPLDVAQSDFAAARRLELVHSDLNAIIWCDGTLADAMQDCRPDTDGGVKTTEPGFRAFREFSVFFHDELKAFFTENFRELGNLGQLAGVRDGFGINYGASGMGTLLLGNRKGIGPAADCMECLYEEFFLTSWANGDPALLEWYADDPSNVHHSYLNDAVVFRNFHAGPKETHVFHLHAHQWFAGNDPNRGSYLDSQTVGPQQGFTYNIYHGGLRDENGAGKGWWDTHGAGNRNRTLGDSIFHCHLYPHFAQGMWELWRVHDVLEDGTRRLPDGQAHDGLSLDFAKAPGDDTPVRKRTGSVDPATGAWLAPEAATGQGMGTPIPALVPLPGEPLPLLPTYADAAATGEGAPLPGYPFYIAGKPGHRPPQAPLDIARNLGVTTENTPSPDIADGVDGRTPVSGGPEWLNAGIDRHVVGDGSRRELGVALPAAVDLPGSPLDGTPLDQIGGAVRSRLASQAVAKAFALGDLSGHLTQANIEPLSPWGSPLERAAMGFHFNGRLYEEGGGSGPALKLARADGAPVTAQVDRGAYASLRAPLPAGVAPPDPAEFLVNGSAPKPGAPFADPCGVARSASAAMADPLGRGWLEQPDFLADPKLDGYRRYEASAVQVDMVVNAAGWHDPQGRINVLTAKSDAYKQGAPWRISPRISDSEEPFFFRALSGECIEFRHTNELPKELELDDFQVRTPTDTIGQHIHLVKFDVTSSDGSGNGWNYEDGTLAPDEAASRLCAWSESSEPDAALAAIADLESRIRAAMTAEEQAGFQDFCSWDVVRGHNLWRLERSRFPFLFQTTVQRWFADPILSRDGYGDAVDRTMRTVFTHDHFGPSSIQQHGFYAALVVEPPARHSPPGNTPGDPANRSQWYPRILEPERGDTALDGAPLAEPLRTQEVAWGDPAWEGARKRVIVAPDAAAAGRDPAYFEHPNYREYALSIADFALLYDPRDREPPILGKVAEQSPDLAGGLDGMARLYCEAYWRLSPKLLGSVCGAPAERAAGAASWHFPGEAPPAWLAGGAYRDDVHRFDYAGDLFVGPHLQADKQEVLDLGAYLTGYRQKAAGKWRPDAADGNATAEMARPVAAPARPEAISVDHHDPYLVNYRGAPIPLRIGASEPNVAQSDDCLPKSINRPGEEGPSDVVDAVASGAFGRCSITHQRTGDGGDLGLAFSSHVHGDPETPILEAYQGERLVMRLIQGAQEVQHTFHVAGQPFRRNIDQHWQRGAQALGLSPEWAGDPTLQSSCFQREVFENARPREYRLWLDTAPARWSTVGIDAGHWQAYEAALAECDNIEGFAFAQEIGISEHFEMQGSLRADVAVSAELAAPLAPPRPEDPVDDNGVPTKSSDYFYSFSSSDALWNGAWGLVRIFQNNDAPDPATLGDPQPAMIGDRLGPVPAFYEDEAADITSAAPGSASGLLCPAPADGATQRVVEFAIVAVEMRQAFPYQKGALHGDNLYDPDGLFLALMSPQQLGLAGIDDAAFGSLTREDVLASIAATYPEQPEPFVLRVRAGDCLQFRLVNLLGSGEGMSDHLGDAIMPKIVPLNVDPIPQLGEEGASPTIGLLQRPEGPETGVRPSARLALSLGLPGLDLIRTVPSGYGFNAPPLPGGEGGVAVSDTMTAYAGRYRMDLPGDPEEAFAEILAPDVASRLFEAVAATPPSALGGELLPALAARASQAGMEEADRIRQFTVISTAETAGLASILGRPVTLAVLEDWDGEGAVVSELCPATGCADDPQELREVLGEVMSRAIAAALNERAHWIPYAFGAVPVQPTTDPVSQIPHGLMGTIDVVPVTWTPLDDDGLRCGAPDAAGYLRCAAGYVAGRSLGDGFAWSAVDEAGEAETLREFVLFWRDGLNLWDEDRPLPWRWADDNTPVWGAMVPDCPVCDDSYDRGEAGVSHHAPSLARLLRATLPAQELGFAGAVHRSDDLNAFRFPPDWPVRWDERIALKAHPGEQVVIRVVHPGGRARQRAFVMNGYTYDDLFPGFGFPRSALLAPGKSVSAWLRPSAAAGISIWHDGPTTLRSAGAWGLLAVEPGEE